MIIDYGIESKQSGSKINDKYNGHYSYWPKIFRSDNDLQVLLELQD